MRTLFLALSLVFSPFALAEEQSEAMPPLAEQVVLEISVTWADDSHPAISGKTNLPEGTLLEVFAEPAASHEVTVTDGTFGVKLGGEEGLAPGEYKVYANMLLPMSQPDEVKAVIGEDGEKLPGEAATNPMTLVVGDAAEEAE